MNNFILILLFFSCVARKVTNTVPLQGTSNWKWIMAIFLTLNLYFRITNTNSLNGIDSGSTSIGMQLALAHYIEWYDTADWEENVYCVYVCTSIKRINISTPYKYSTVVRLFTRSFACGARILFQFVCIVSEWVSEWLWEFSMRVGMRTLKDYKLHPFKHIEYAKQSTNTE